MYTYPEEEGLSFGGLLNILPPNGMKFVNLKLGQLALILYLLLSKYVYLVILCN